MTDNEKVQSFSDMVNATERLTKPWKTFCGLILAALVLTNLIWGFVLWRQLKYAYMTPEEFSQSQQFEDKTQEQHYSQGGHEG